ncbi:MAG: RNA polymerase subunit sigma-70 [Alphaproteobacteria bacterium]|nr:RNA polymerase subunit sigma-70 [Alphaproteobacteria bacterium]
MSTNEIGVTARNIKRISRLDLPGGGQIIVDGKYAYIGHMDPPHGTSILDISDPKNPRVVSTIEHPDNYSHSHKVRVNGDVMIVNIEQYNRHFLRLGDRIPELRASLEAELGRAPGDADLAKALKVKESDIPGLGEAQARGYNDGGFKVYDVSDRANPRQIAYERTFGFGTHRFDADADYAYISTEMEGYIGNILVIYDMANPERPEEVSRWWMEGQHLAGGEKPTWRGYRNRLHHALRQGDRLWASCWQGGFRVIDIADIANPKTIGGYDYHPPFPEPTHTVLPFPFPIDGKDVAVVIDEEHAPHPGQPHAFMWLFDVTNVEDMKPLSTFHVSEADSPWSRMGERFGAHQYQEHFSDTRVFMTWFSGGLRVVDVANPLLPEEIAHFIPEPGKGAKTPQSNDVDVDENGLIYLMDRINGLDILEITV